MGDDGTDVDVNVEVAVVVVCRRGLLDLCERIESFMIFHTKALKTNDWTKDERRRKETQENASETKESKGTISSETHAMDEANRKVQGLCNHSAFKTTIKNFLSYRYAARTIPIRT